MNRLRNAEAFGESDSERWMVSYADFITLLFGFFVVMYAISSVNDEKYRVLSAPLSQEFESEPMSIDPISVGEHPRSIEVRLSRALAA